MKRLLVLFLVIIMAFGCFTSCEKGPVLTNEDLITERIETFLTAYNSGDMEGVLNCLDAKSRNTFQAMLNLFGGLFGGLTGFSLDLSDLFSLGISTSSGDFMELEISNVTVIDGECAIATTKMFLTGEGTKTIYFEMVYENDAWYIHNMTDCKPSDFESNQDSNVSSGDSTNTGGNGNLDYSSYTDEGVVYLLSTDGQSAEVVDYTGTAEMVKIAEIYEGVPVTTIGTRAFANKGITSVIIPDSVTNIDLGAFKGCNSLNSITLPFIGSNEIGGDAHNLGYIFSDKFGSRGNSAVPNSLETVIITRASLIGDDAFKDCTHLKCVIIPDSVTYIKQGAFENCNNLFEKEDGVSYIGKWVVDFDNSKAIVSVREGTVGIAEDSFYYDTKLRSLSLPDSIAYICDSAIHGCSELQYNLHNNGYYLGNEKNPYLALVKIKDKTTSECSIYENTKCILKSAFNSCTNLKSVTIPNSVTSIGSQQFVNCTNLTNVTLPNDLTFIGDYTFKNCTNLENVTIPDSVEIIGSYAFYGCTNLSSVTVENPDGWFAGTIRIPSTDLSNSSTAATYLMSTYCGDYYWHRN